MMAEVKNIIMVCDFANITGGAEKVAIMSAVALADTGYHVVLFCGKGPVCSELKNSTVEVVCLNQEEAIKDKNKSRGIVRGIYNSSARAAMEELLSSYNPKDTVIHMHGWSKVFSSSIFLPIKKRDFKVLVTMHDYFLLCPNGCFYDFQNKSVCERKPMSGSCIKCNCDKRNYSYKLYRLIRQFIMYRMVKGTKLNLAFISEFNKSVSSKRIPFKYGEIMITNPVDVDLQEVVKVENNSQYIFIGRLSYEKGIDCFCEAVTKAKVKAVAIGSGDRMEELVKKYPNVSFIGWKSKEEMKQYILESRALIFPSVWYEGAPLTIPEVMGGYALPCIISDKCAGRDYITDRQTGLLFECGNAERLFETIQYAEDNAVISALQENILDTFNRDLYSNKSHVSNLLSYYGEMLNGR